MKIDGGERGVRRGGGEGVCARVLERVYERR